MLQAPRRRRGRGRHFAGVWRGVTDLVAMGYYDFSGQEEESLYQRPLLLLLLLGFRWQSR